MATLGAISRAFSPGIREVADAARGDARAVSRDPCQTIAQIEQIALATEKLESMCDFYRQLGAVASRPSTDPETGRRTCELDFCGVRLELIETPPGRSERRSPALLCLGFALGTADAVDELTGVIAAAGYRLLEPPHRTSEFGRYESIVLDPDCNRVKLTV